MTPENSPTATKRSLDLASVRRIGLAATVGADESGFMTAQTLQIAPSRSAAGNSLHSSSALGYWNIRDTDIFIDS
jgi:hypothetical protein